MSYLSHVEYKLIQVLIILIISYILLILIKQFIKANHVSPISKNILRFSLFLIFLKKVCKLYISILK